MNFSYGNNDCPPPDFSRGTIKINVADVKLTPPERNPAQEQRLALKMILDRWMAMTISLEDAYNAILEIMAATLGTTDIEAGHLKIRSSGLAFGADVEINGKKFDEFRKLTYIMECGKHDKLVIESDCGYIPAKKAE